MVTMLALFQIVLTLDSIQQLKVNAQYSKYTLYSSMNILQDNVLFYGIGLLFKQNVVLIE